MVHICMVSHNYGTPYGQRENELRDADWYYGLRYEPIFPRFEDIYTGTLDDNWDMWYDGKLDKDPAQVALGRLKAATYLATQIRLYKPDVIATHDFDGEYGHINHKATALAVADAYAMAADPNLNLAGLPAWQTSKLYIHQSQNNGLGTAGMTFQGWLFHDYFEELSIDTNGDGIPDISPRRVADIGVDLHVSQGPHDSSTVYRVGENSDGEHQEWWGLYASSVGPDTLVDPFTLMGYNYVGWARGDFFENVPVPEPGSCVLSIAALFSLFLFAWRK